jgi:hypothetical protein
MFAWRIFWMSLCLTGTARADSDPPIVVTACGTPPVTYAAGQPNALTQNTTGRLCVETTCAALPITYVVGKSYLLFVDTNGRLCSSGG